MYQFQSTFRYFGDFLLLKLMLENESYITLASKNCGPDRSRIKQQYQDGYEAKIDATIELYKL